MYHASKHLHFPIVRQDVDIRAPQERQERVCALSHHYRLCEPKIKVRAQLRDDAVSLRSLLVCLLDVALRNSTVGNIIDSHRGTTERRSPVRRARAIRVQASVLWRTNHDAAIHQNPKPYVRTTSTLFIVH